MLGKTDSTAKYYVYLLIEPTTMQPFYIGKGTGDRMFNHVTDVKKMRMPNGGNQKLFSKIEQIHNTGTEVGYEVAIDNVDEITALAVEAAFIDYYGIDNLCNLQASGFGGDNKTPELVFMGIWANAKQMFQRAIAKHGTWDAYIEHRNKSTHYRWLMKKYGSFEAFQLQEPLRRKQRDKQQSLNRRLKVAQNQS